MKTNVILHYQQPVQRSTSNSVGNTQQILRLDDATTIQNKYFKNAIVKDICVQARIKGEAEGSHGPWAHENLGPT